MEYEGNLEMPASQPSWDHCQFAHLSEELSGFNPTVMLTKIMFIICIHLGDPTRHKGGKGGWIFFWHWFSQILPPFSLKHMQTLDRFITRAYKVSPMCKMQPLLPMKERWERGKFWRSKFSKFAHYCPQGPSSYLHKHQDNHVYSENSRLHLSDNSWLTNLTNLTHIPSTLKKKNHPNKNHHKNQPQRSTLTPTITQWITTSSTSTS